MGVVILHYDYCHNDVHLSCYKPATCATDMVFIESVILLSLLLHCAASRLFTSPFLKLLYPHSKSNDISYPHCHAYTAPFTSNSPISSPIFIQCQFYHLLWSRFRIPAMSPFTIHHSYSHHYPYSYSHYYSYRPIQGPILHFYQMPFPFPLV